MAKAELKSMAIGRRKTSRARVRIYPGTGQITCNGKPSRDYFMRATLEMIIRQPLDLAECGDQFDIIANLDGGGLTGQAGALRHGISRALLGINSDFRKVLKAAGFLTRDPRMVERKKYGRRGARARYQFSKR